MKFLRSYQNIIIGTLVVLMAIVVLFATVDLAIAVFQEIVGPIPFVLSAAGFPELLSLFLLVLVGLEILDTIKAYLDEHVVHVEIVLLAALVAIARKVITLDIKNTSAMTMLGIAAILAALTVGYYLFKRANPSP